MTLFKLTSAMLLVAFVAAPAVSDAAVLGTYTRDYGNGSGKIDPVGVSSRLTNDRVILDDQATGQRFSDSIDFSSLSYGAITGFNFRLRYENTDDTLTVTMPFVGTFEFDEDWRVRIQGTNPSDDADDLFLDLTRTSSPTETGFTIDNSSDVGSIDVFAQSVTTETFQFLFAEEAFGANTARIDYAELDVIGTAAPTQAIPLPGTLALLLPWTALLGCFAGGFGFWRAKK